MQLPSANPFHVSVLSIQTSAYFMSVLSGQQKCAACGTDALGYAKLLIG